MALQTRSRLRTAYRWIAGMFAITVIVLALLVSVFRMVVPQVPAYRGEIVEWASGVLGAPVAIQSLDLQWRRVRPELVLSGVSFVSADARGAVAAREVRVGISLRTLVQYGRFAPATITLVEPDITLVLEAQDAEASGADWQRAFSAGTHRGDLGIVRGRITLLADSGRRRVEFTALDLRVSSDGLRHEIRGTGRLAEAIGGMLRIRGEARGWPENADFSANARVEMRRMDAVGVQRLTRVGRLTAGQLDAVMTLDVADGAAQRLIVDIGMSGLRWADSSVERAAGEFVWRRRDTGWEAMLQRLDVTRDGVYRTSGPLTVTYTEPALDDPTAAWVVGAGRVEIADIALLGEISPWDPDGVFRMLVERSPRGTLEHGQLRIQRPADGPQSYDLKLVASELGLGPLIGSRVPGFSGFAIDLETDEANGKATVSVTDGSFEMPDALRAPFEIAQGGVALQWARGDSGWAAFTDSLTLRSPDMRLTARIDYNHTLGLLNVHSEFGDVRLESQARYLPVTVLPEDVIAWLDRAVIAGTAKSGHLKLALVDIHSEDNRSMGLDIEFEGEGITLDYADNWPIVEDARISARFTENTFAATVHSAEYAGVPVLGAEVRIDDFAKPVLDVDARAGNNLSDMFDGLRRTPIARAEWLSEANAGGTAELDLQLVIDLSRNAPVQVRGGVQLDHASFHVGGFDHSLTAMVGRISIGSDGFEANQISAVLLGDPVVVGARTLRDSNRTARAVEVMLDGVLDRNVLRRLVGHDDVPVSGRTNWHARVLAPYDAIEAPIVSVESDLAGLEISLPHPLGKSVDQRVPVALQLELSGERRRVVVDGGARLRMDATLEARDSAWTIARGRLHLGPGTPGPIPERDMAVTGRIESWQLALGGLVPRLATVEIPLSSVGLVIGSFNAWGHDLGEISLDGRRSDLGWYWMLDGEQLSGAIDIPDHTDDERPVRVDFKHLNMPVAVRERPDQPVHADPTTLPPIAFHAGDLHLGTMHLGEVNGFVRPVEHGIRLDGFTAHRSEMRMNVDASWQMVDGQHRTVVRGSLESTDVRPTLAALGYIASVDAAAGHLQVDVSWMDSPLSNPLPTLDGELSVRLERGTLHDLQPGAGRIFGLLSLYALPRRLALDFSDVFRRGLAFDSIRGSFTIQEGQAFTDDLVLMGPAARVEIKGRTGLASRDYDQEATVIGSLASSLTLAGTLVGGPAVGAALLVMSEILRRPLEDMVRARYRLHGPWEDPLVERIP